VKKLSHALTGIMLSVYLRNKTQEMKKFILIMFLFAQAIPGYSQERFYEKAGSNKVYIILTNPTVGNIETILFQTGHQILVTDPEKTEFVGVYHKNQAYDFQKSSEYIRENALERFSLLELSGELTESDIFSNNSCTEEFRKIFSHSAGIFFFGGPDIQPELYGETNSRSVVTDPGRHIFEVSFLFHLLGSSRNPGFKPFLEDNPEYMVTGFCLGLQTMNVATGGTLVQDIPLEIYHHATPQETVTTDRNNLHRNYWQEFNSDKQLMGINLHPVYFNEHSFFGKSVLVSKSFHPLVYSSHHQSIEQIGKGFEVTALSADGRVIEGLAHRQYPNVFGVQFHPEVPALYENRETWKFEPGDVPRTYHEILGDESVSFHRAYWKRISDGLKSSVGYSQQERK
jgi:putative glutamine amidotransferase